MLTHVHKNILDSINLADAANEFVDGKDSRKQKFWHFPQNYWCYSIYYVRLLCYIIYYVSLHLSNFHMRSTRFHVELNLSLDFYEKNPCKKKQVRVNYFDEKEKPWTYLKMFHKQKTKKKKFKAIWAVLGYSKSKFFSFSQTTMVADIFSIPWPPSYSIAATAL